MQVRLEITGGKIKQVDVIEYPNGNPRDAEINSYALPILVQETTEAQSVNIDMVSGATVTSTGYLQSLQSALDQANL
ncbi:MAG: FMN-binding protein [Marmoricola sp.]